MSTKERIQAEISSLSPDELEELYLWVLEFIESKRRTKQESLFAQLRAIKIDGPTDFSENHDLYLSGEKSARTNSA